MDPIQIPDKTYFKIGEVAKLLDLQPYVLRYWETEFDALRPEKTKSGQRAYRRDDIELLILVKTLLYDEMYTIAGARRQLKLRKKGAIEPLGPEAQQRLVTDHQGLLEEQTAWDRERARLAAAADQHREEASRLRMQNETLEDENVQLASAQLEYESSIERMREESTQQRDAVRQLEESLEQRMEAMAEDSTSRSDEAQLAMRNSENVERIAVLETERDQAAERAGEAMSELQANQVRVEELAEALAASTAAVEAAGVERQNLTNELESLEADLASAETELERLEGEKLVLATQALNSVELEALEVKLSDALSRIEVLQTERDGVAQRHDQHSQHQRERYSFLRHELESLAAIVN